jgi:hypothetical protein
MLKILGHPITGAVSEIKATFINSSTYPTGENVVHYSSIHSEVIVNKIN